MELNFWVATGQRVYPEFREEFHCVPLIHRPRKTIYRAWDFGWHAPACLIAQIDTKDRLMILAEVIGHELTTKQFAPIVLDRCAELFGAHTAGYEDFCDPAGQQRRSTAESSEIQDVKILNSFGIYPTWQWGWSRRDGRALVHALLAERSDGSPSLVVNSGQCPALVQGFLGKYVYPPSRDGRANDEPDEGNHPWSDVHAGLRYLATGLYTMLGLRRPGRSQQTDHGPVNYQGYGSPLR